MSKALANLGREVDGCVTSFLRKKGIPLQLTKLSSGPTDFCSIYSLFDLHLSVVSHAKYVLLQVGQKAFFSEKFLLHNTKSPKKVAWLLLKWLKVYSVKQVMDV